MTKARRKINPYLSSARAYWRLAAKADRNGQFRLAEHYRTVADQRYGAYVRSLPRS